MAEYRTYPPGPADVDALLAGMREADRVELTAASGADLRGTVEVSLDNSHRAWALELYGDLGALLGVVPTEVDGLGVPWLIGTTAIDRHARTHIRATRRYLAVMRDLYPQLINYVHAENHRSVRWLRWMGFTIHAPEPVGRNGELFHRFEMGVPNV